MPTAGAILESACASGRTLDRFPRLHPGYIERSVVCRRTLFRLRIALPMQTRVHHRSHGILATKSEQMDEERRYAVQQQRQAEEERERAEKLAAQLRALGVEPDA